LICLEFNFEIVIYLDNSFIIGMNKLGFLKDKYPLLVCAPMVDQSELAFRLLTRRYGSNLCYTPMLHSRMLITQKTYKNEHFTTCPEDRPLVAQLCGDDPETLLKAAQMLENEVDAIDLNFGCPQGIARKGHYGSFLLAEPDLIIRIVETMSAGLKVPLFCKMRVLKDEEKTLDLAKRMEKAGCSLLAVHGRTKEQNKERVGLCDWSIIRKIKETLKIPVLANGGVYNYADV
jgi:tRNA-dihydrouridine synthase 1